VHVPAGVVSWDGDLVDSLNLLDAIESLHLVLVSLLQDLSVVEVVWVDFVDSWQFNAVEVLAVIDGCGQSIDELAFVDVEAVELETNS